jgi:Cu+-exporting ATPase
VATRQYADDSHRRERAVELVIGGVTCASSAGRMEKKLNRLDGVTATVNFRRRDRAGDVPGRGQRRRPDLGGRAGRISRGAAREPARAMPDEADSLRRRQRVVVGHQLAKHR